MKQDRLLAIDDEPAIGELIKHIAEDLGFDVQSTAEPESFRSALQAFEPTVIVLDLQMPGADGIELLRHLAETRSMAQVLVVSGVDVKVLDTVRRLGTAHGLNMLGALQKPILVPQLETLLRGAMEVNRTIGAGALAQAIAAGEIDAFYQPKAALQADGSWLINAVEALCRWSHPRLGTIMPGQFIPIAEKEGLISSLTYAVFRRAIEQARRWREAGLALKVAVNLSPRILDDLDLPDELYRMVRANDIDPNNIIVEVTESGVMDDPARAMEILSRLRLKGFRLSIDDFGTGYSSLVQLYRLPFNEMKIDRSFVNETRQNAEADVIVSSILGLGKSLGLAVCAEGVERQETLDYLRSLACDTVQGFLLSKPLPADQLTAFVRRWNGRH